MKKMPVLVFIFGILFLFFIQSAGTLVESIYILDLLNSKMDEKVLGVLFFFAPLLLFPFFPKYPRLLGWLLFAVLLLSRGLIPYLTTTGRLPAAGIAAVAALGLFFLLLAARPRGESNPQVGLWGSAGLALAVGLSTLLRTVNQGVEYSLIPAGGWSGWVLGLLLGGLFTRVDFKFQPATRQKGQKTTAPLVGIYLLITLVYFVFSAPAVIARWTEGSYPFIVGAISLLSLGWVGLVFYRPRLLDSLSRPLLLIWNALFTLALTGTLLAQRVAFPPALQSPEVVVGTPSLLQQVPLVFMLLLFPVIFADMRIFLARLQGTAPSFRSLAPGVALGSFALILLVFMHIFTNVWGYVKPVSLWFRNAFWLPHLLLAGGAGLLAWLAQQNKPTRPAEAAPAMHPGWLALPAAILLVTVIASLPGQVSQSPQAGKTSLVAMTYNVQQFNDDPGEKSIDRQIELVRRASPDILALQESDSARISLNNNDYVRYFAEKLGYYSYYGPTPLTGTFGTAILSRYPLENTRSVFIYSDKDETGVAEAEVVIGGRRFSIYNVHPDSSDPAMLRFAQTVVERSKGKPNVIALGDFNLRDYEEAYKLFASMYTNAWVSVYPTEISPEGVDMSGENRIDHIFFSPDLKARKPVYVLQPESATDHPVHWAEIYW